MSHDHKVSEYSMTLAAACAAAQEIADRDGIVMAVGLQTNDVTGEEEYGYCPLANVGPVFVHTVLESLSPYRGGRADHATRQEARRERLETAAERAGAEARGAFQRARSAVAGIPPGQPILVGHHSERRHRRDLERHDRAMRRGFEADKRAGELASRADAVGSAGISSDDPEAVRKLREQLAECTASQERMKAANKVVKSKLSDDAKVQALTGQGFPESVARKLLEPDYCGRVGFASYALSNNSANMRRIQSRIAGLQRTAAITEGEIAQSVDGCVLQVGDNRVQLVFPGKPADEVRAHLKSWGFRWARSAGAWQRHLNNHSLYAGRQVLEWLNVRAGKAQGGAS